MKSKLIVTLMLAFGISISGSVAGVGDKGGNGLTGRHSGNSVFREGGNGAGNGFADLGGGNVGGLVVNGTEHGNGLIKRTAASR